MCRGSLDLQFFGSSGLANDSCFILLVGMQGVPDVFYYCQCLSVTFIVRVLMLLQPSLQSPGSFTNIHFATVTRDPVDYLGVFFSLVVYSSPWRALCRVFVRV